MLKKFNYFFKAIWDNISNKKYYIPKLRVYWSKDEIMDLMLSFDDELKSAYQLKSVYQEFNSTATYDQKDELSYFIEKYVNRQSEEFREFGRLLIRWKNEIANSFPHQKQRRVSNGMTSFERFRKRVMYSINKDGILMNTKK